MRKRFAAGVGLKHASLVWCSEAIRYAHAFSQKRGMHSCTSLYSKRDQTTRSTPKVKTYQNILFFGTGRFISGPCSEVDEVIAAHQACPGKLSSPGDFGDEIAGSTFFSCSNKNEAFAGKMATPSIWHCYHDHHVRYTPMECLPFGN